MPYYYQHKMKCVITLSVVIVSVNSFSINYKEVAKVAKAGAVAAVIASGLVIPPALTGNFDEGEKIFSANYTACHAIGQNVIMPDKTLEKEALDTYLTGGRNEDAVKTQVTNGKNAMPAFKGRLSENDIANVATYVISTSESGWEELFDE